MGFLWVPNNIETDMMAKKFWSQIWFICRKWILI